MITTVFLKITIYLYKYYFFIIQRNLNRLNSVIAFSLKFLYIHTHIVIYAALKYRGKIIALMILFEKMLYFIYTNTIQYVQVMHEEH